MADNGIDFGQSSQEKYSLRPLLNRQETAMPIAHDMAQAIQVADNAYKSYEQISDKATQHRYFNAVTDLNNINSEHQDSLLNVGEDLVKQDALKNEFRGKREALISKYQLDEKYGAELGTKVSSINNHYEETYRVKYNAQQEGIADSNIAIDLGASIGVLTPEQMKIKLNELGAYRKEVTGADDRTNNTKLNTIFMRAAVNSIDPNTLTFEQASQLRKDTLQTVLDNDPKMVGTAEYTQFKNGLEVIEEHTRAKEEERIKAIVGDSSLSDKFIQEELASGVSRGIFSKEKANGFFDVVVSKNRKDRQDLVQKQLTDMDLSREEALKLVNDPKAMFSEDDKKMLLEGHRISQKRYNMDIAIRSITNIAGDPTTAVEDKIKIVYNALELTNNPLEKEAIQSQINKLNKEKETKDKQEATNIAYTKGMEFGSKIASIVSIYPEDTPLRAKLIGSAIAEETKKQAGKSPETKVEQKDFEAFIKNPEKSIGEKLLAVESASYLTGTQKDSTKAQLVAKAQKEGRVLATAATKESREMFKGLYNEAVAQAQSGVYDRSPHEVINAAAGAYAGKAIPVTVKAFTDKYTNEYDMYQDFKAGKDNTVNPKYLNSSLPLRSDVKQNIEASFNAASDSNSLANVVNAVKTMEKGKFLIPKEMSEKASVAAMFLQYSPENAAERFQKYLREPATGDNVQKQITKIKNDIAASQGMAGGYLSWDIPEGSPYLSNISSIAEASLKAGMSKDEIRTMIKKSTENNYVDVGSMFSARHYIPKTSFIQSKEDYKNMIDMVNVKTNTNASAAFPSDFTNPENSSWGFRVTRPNGTIETVSYSAQELKTLLHMKKGK